MAVEQPPSPGTEYLEVQSRRDLAAYLSLSLPGEYKITVGESGVRNTAAHVKSYLLESHDAPDGKLVDQLAALFPRVVPLADKTLILVLDDAKIPYFVDALHPRFRVLHTIAPAKDTDPVFQRMTEADGSRFDHLWMPGHFLRHQHRGRLTGFTFRYETEVSGVAPIDVDHSTGEISDRSSSFRMQVAEDTAAEREYDKLVTFNVFEGRKALEQIQFRASDEDVRSDVITNTIYSYGKIVGKGTSIESHLLTVNSVISAYAQIIERIEDEFAVGWVSQGNGYVHQGEPFIFEFPPDVEVADLAAFAGSLFRSTKPFRLFGIPHNSSERRIDVEAIDLHTGDPLAFEITPTWMRVFLPRGSCGNIIARLYSNLQHAMSSDVRLWVGDNEDPFGQASR